MNTVGVAHVFYLLIFNTCSTYVEVKCVGKFYRSVDNDASHNNVSDQDVFYFKKNKKNGTANS